MRSPLRPLPAAVTRWTATARVLGWLDALAAYLAIWVGAAVVFPSASGASLAVLAVLVAALGALLRPLRVRWRPVRGVPQVIMPGTCARATPSASSSQLAAERASSSPASLTRALKGSACAARACCSYGRTRPDNSLRPCDLSRGQRKCGLVWIHPRVPSRRIERPAVAGTGLALTCANRLVKRMLLHARLSLESTSMSRAISRRMRRPVERLRASKRKEGRAGESRPSSVNKEAGGRAGRPAWC